MRRIPSYENMSSFPWSSDARRAAASAKVEVKVVHTSAAPHAIAVGAADQDIALVAAIKVVLALATHEAVTATVAEHVISAASAEEVIATPDTFMWAPPLQ